MGSPRRDAASASGDVSSKSDKDFKLRHAVDIGMLAEAPDAAAAMALAGKLTGADVPPEEAFHPKRPEAEMLKVVQDNADILHDMQSGAMSVEDPQGAEALRHLDLVKFKEVLKRKFLEGPGSNQSAWEALNRSMVDLDTAKAKNREYEEARSLQAVLDTTTWDPFHLGRESSTIDRGWILLPIDWLSETQPGVGSVQCHWGIRQGEAHDCRASTTGLSWQAFD